ncbi:MAG: sterol carrier protein domain-containing protein, partial [Actinomycetota bacterium]|nr:sterol carrier protein domain-containing protein [Actinomycetota bacterium]
WRIMDALWVRVIDVAGALKARSYASSGAITFELSDRFCEANAGVWELEASVQDAAVRRSNRPPELSLDVGDLASAYLGGFSFRQLQEAGHVRELSEGAVERADALFRTTLAPWCPEIF